MSITKKGSRSGSSPIGDGFLQTAAALNATAQQVTDNVGNGSALYLATTSALVKGDKLQIGSSGDTTFLAFNDGYFNIYNDATLQRNGGDITHQTNSLFPLRSHITGENTMPYSVLIGGGVVGNKPDANNTLEVIGMGTSTVTKAGIFLNSSLNTILELLDDQSILGYSGNQKRFKFGHTTGGQEISTRDGELSIGIIDAGPSAGIRLLSTGTGYTYLDGYSEGTTKSQNYPMVLGSRINNTGLNIIGSTTQENGTPIIIGSQIYDASAILNINSTTRGFLTPRMTTANFAAIASKAQGLEAFSTDDSGKLWYDGTRTVGYRYNGSNFQGYNGSSWSNLGALQFFTESYASSTQASSQFLATNAATNINAVLAAKGNGAVLAQTPDGTSAGGDSRGFWAADWQKVRAAANQVASGSQSVIGGGYGNMASGYASTVPGGYRNEARANSSVAEGEWSKAYIYGQKAKASGNFPASSITGEAQASEAVVRKAATALNAGDNTELFANGTTEKLIPDGNNRAWNVVVETVAVCTAVGGGSGTVGDTYTSIYNLAFKRVGGTSSIVGTEDLINSNADAGMAGALLVFSTGASQELKIEWQAPTSATGSNFKIVSNVRLAEVAF